MDDQGGYAPRSPDLSAYHSGPAPPSLQSPSQQQYQPPAFPPYQPPPSAPQYNPPSAAGYQPPPPYFPPSAQAFPMGTPQQQPAGGGPHAPGPSLAPNAEMVDAPETPTTGPGRGRGRKPRKPKPEEPSDEGLPPAPGVAEGIEVKTKFPVARIKRIMQADEDVGKVAQVTPTAVSKALELFMISLVTKSAAQARSKSAKKVTAQHLKQVIQQDESFDFLSEIVSRIPDAPASKKEAKAEDSDEGETKKKRGRGKRKTDDDDW